MPKLLLWDGPGLSPAEIGEKARTLQNYLSEEGRSDELLDVVVCLSEALEHLWKETENE